MRRIRFRWRWMSQSRKTKKTENTGLKVSKELLLKMITYTKRPKSWLGFTNETLLFCSIFQLLDYCISNTRESSSPCWTQQSHLQITPDLFMRGSCSLMGKSEFCQTSFSNLCKLSLILLQQLCFGVKNVLCNHKAETFPVCFKC